MTQCVVFDLDDTLYLERDYVRSGFEAVDLFLKEKGVTDFFDRAWSYFSSGGRGNTFNVVLDQMNVEYDTKLISKLVDVYRCHQPQISLLPDAVTVLNELVGSYPLGLITDGFGKSQRNKIRSLGLENIFEYIVVTDELGVDRKYWKPHAKPYETVRQFFSVPHNKCVYVGDNPKKDFVTANKLDWLTVQVNHSGAEYQEAVAGPEFLAKFKIDSLESLPKVLKRAGDIDG